MLQFQSQISLNIVRQRWLPILKICIFETKALKIKFPLVFLISSKKSGTLLFKITPPSPIGLEILQNMAKIWRLHSPPPPPLLKRGRTKYVINICILLLQIYANVTRVILIHFECCGTKKFFTKETSLRKAISPSKRLFLTIHYLA